MNKIGILVGLMIVFATAPTAMAVHSSDLNQTINISYGIVEHVKRSKVKSNAGKGALMGGLLGAATSRHHNRGKHALTGVLAGGIITSMLEGKHHAYTYLIQTVNGGAKQVVTEQSGIREGDCVSVEEGRMTNVRRVAMVHCQHRQHAVMSEPMVHAKATGDAAECHAAKAMALKASTESEIDLAMKKVQIFCD